MGRGRKHNILQEAVTKSCCETMVLQRRRFCLLGGDIRIANNILVITAQMAKRYSGCLGSCKLGFDSESGQTSDFKIGIHSFPA